AKGAQFTGQVTDARTGAPLSGAFVTIYEGSTSAFVTSTFVSGGTYQTTGLDAGSYRIHTFNDIGYQDQLFDRQPCLGGNCLLTDGTIAVLTERQIRSVDFALSTGGNVVGRIVDEGTGAPIAGAQVDVYAVIPGSAPPQTQFVHSARTGLDGHFILRGLATGT